MSEDRPAVWLVLGLLAAAAAVFIGYPPESWYKSYYLPFIFRHMDPGLYAGDLFVGSETVYHSLFFPAAARLLKYVSLETLFPALAFIAASASLVLIYRIGMLLFDNGCSAALAAALLFFGKPAISLSVFTVLTEGLFEPAHLARPFLLLGIWLFLGGRHHWACFVVGTMFNIQGMEAFFVAAMFMFYLLTNPKRFPPMHIVHAGLLLAVPALPMVWHAVAGGFLGSHAPEELGRWLAILNFRSFYHLFPFSWGAGDWFRYSGWFLWTYIVLRYSRPSAEHGVIMSFWKAVALLCLAGTVFVELFPVPAAVKLVLWRSTMFYVLFLVLYIGDYLVNFPKDTPLRLALAAGTAASLIFNSFSFNKLIPCFALLHLAFHWSDKKLPGRLAGAAGLCGICLLMAAGLLSVKEDGSLAGKVLTLGGFDRMDLALFAVSALGIACLLWLRRTRGPRPLADNVMLAALCAALLALRFGWPENIGEARLREDWKGAQLWASENTPPGTVFITPPYLEGFRIHSRRGVVAENKDGAACVYDIGFTFKWWERMNDLGYNDLGRTVLDYVPESRRGYLKLGGEELLRLRRKYGADYFVTEGPGAPDLRQVYRNGHFRIYHLAS